MTTAQRSSLCLLTTVQLESVVARARIMAREAKAEEGANSTDNSAPLPFTPLARWELAGLGELPRRARSRMSGEHAGAVQLVSVRIQDTAARARRAATT